MGQIFFESDLLGDPAYNMAVSCCSLVALYTLFLRRAFRAAGLAPKVIIVDHKTTLHCWVPEFPDEGKPAVVLVHGFGPSAEYQWRRQVKYLSKFFNLYVPDLVFFGESTTTSSERSEVFQAKCVAGLMERLGVGRYSVVGTSYGGFVAYHLARNHGERLEKVVVASSAPNRRRMDNMGVLERAKAAAIENLMLPSTAKQLRMLMSLSFYKPPSFMPDFLLNDIINVSAYFLS